MATVTGLISGGMIHAGPAGIEEAPSSPFHLGLDMAAGSMHVGGIVARPTGIDDT